MNDSRSMPQFTALRAGVAGAMRAGLLPAVVATTILTGHIVDRTTGQPLTGVDVSISGPANARTARTDDAGGYQLRGLSPGRYTITLSSDDVPPQTFVVTVRTEKRQAFNMTACSTTLDYSCAAATP